MKIVKVTYTTNPEYSSTNQSNIKQVMSDLQKLAHTGIHYHACLGPDGKTFIHTAFYREEADQKILNDLPSFKYFQEQLKASSPEGGPKQELLSLVGSSWEMFKVED